MPLDYNEAKRVFWKKMGDKVDGHGAMDAALLALCEFVYRRGLEDGVQSVADTDQMRQPFVNK